LKLRYVIRYNRYLQIHYYEGEHCCPKSKDQFWELQWVMLPASARKY
jgi:hypothetical protein